MKKLSLNFHLKFLELKKSYQHPGRFRHHHHRLDNKPCQSLSYNYYSKYCNSFYSAYKFAFLKECCKMGEQVTIAQLYGNILSYK